LVSSIEASESSVSWSDKKLDENVQRLVVDGLLAQIRRSPFSVCLPIKCLQSALRTSLVDAHLLFSRLVEPNVFCARRLYHFAGYLSLVDQFLPLLFPAAESDALESHVLLFVDVVQRLFDAIVCAQQLLRDDDGEEEEEKKEDGDDYDYEEDAQFQLMSNAVESARALADNLLGNVHVSAMMQLAEHMDACADRWRALVDSMRRCFDASSRCEPMRELLEPLRVALCEAMEPSAQHSALPSMASSMPCAAGSASSRSLRLAAPSTDGMIDVHASSLPLGSMRLGGLRASIVWLVRDSQQCGALSDSVSECAERFEAARKLDALERVDFFTQVICAALLAERSASSIADRLVARSWLFGKLPRLLSAWRDAARRSDSGVANALRRRASFADALLGAFARVGACDKLIWRDATAASAMVDGDGDASLAAYANADGQVNMLQLLAIACVQGRLIAAADVLGNANADAALMQHAAAHVHENLGDALTALRTRWFDGQSACDALIAALMRAAAADDGDNAHEQLAPLWPRLIDSATLRIVADVHARASGLVGALATLARQGSAAGKHALVGLALGGLRAIAYQFAECSRRSFASRFLNVSDDDDDDESAGSVEPDSYCLLRSLAERNAALIDCALQVDNGDSDELLAWFRVETRRQLPRRRQCTDADCDASLPSLVLLDNAYALGASSDQDAAALSALFASAPHIVERTMRGLGDAPAQRRDAVFGELANDGNGSVQRCARAALAQHAASSERTFTPNLVSSGIVDVDLDLMARRCFDALALNECECAPLKFRRQMAQLSSLSDGVGSDGLASALFARVLAFASVTDRADATVDANAATANEAALLGGALVARVGGLGALSHLFERMAPRYMRAQLAGASRQHAHLFARFCASAVAHSRTLDARIEPSLGSLLGACTNIAELEAQRPSRRIVFIFTLVTLLARVDRDTSALPGFVAALAPIARLATALLRLGTDARFLSSFYDFTSVEQCQSFLELMKF
jgi:hypothetical protein